MSLTTGWTLRKTIVLVGMMGCGKTAIGRDLSLRLGVPFLDSDAEIEAAAAMSIAEIFERDGEAFFRMRESEVIDRLLGGPSAVLSTGGGAFMVERNRDMISARGVSIWLNADLPLLWNRVKHKDTRPLLRTDDPYATLEALHVARAPLYALADLQVQAHASYTIPEMTARVLDTLAARPDVLEAAT